MTRNVAAFLSLAIIVDVAAGMSFDFSAFQKTLENGCKCGKGFYSGEREQRRMDVVRHCINEMNSPARYEPQVPVETECPQAAISTYARLNNYGMWKRENFPGPLGRRFDSCVFNNLGYLNNDGSMNQEAFLNEITNSIFEVRELATDKDAIILLQTILARGRGATCNTISEPEEFIRCVMKPCFGTAAVPKL